MCIRDSLLSLSLDRTPPPRPNSGYATAFVMETFCSSVQRCYLVAILFCPTCYGMVNRQLFMYYNIIFLQFNVKLNLLHVLDRRLVKTNTGTPKRLEETEAVIQKDKMQQSTMEILYFDFVNI